MRFPLQYSLVSGFVDAALKVPQYNVLLVGLDGAGKTVRPLCPTLYHDVYACFARSVVLIPLALQSLIEQLKFMHCGARPPRPDLLRPTIGLNS